MAIDTSITTIIPERKTPWTFGVDVSAARTSEEALELAGLNFDVLQADVNYEAAGQKFIVPHTKLNYRSDKPTTNLGIVSDRYKIVQNREAFDFTNSLVEQYNGTATFDRFGSHAEGKIIWMSMKLNPVDVLGDQVQQYICFSNTHDGSASVKAFITPVRLICSNVLNMAFDKAIRSLAIRHIGDIAAKKHDAAEVLGLTASYTEKLQEEADRLAGISVSDEKVEDIAKMLFPVDNKMSERQINNTLELRTDFINRYLANDLVRFRNTAWGVVNAAADFADHADSHRNTETLRSNNLLQILNGHKVLDATYNLYKVA